MRIGLCVNGSISCSMTSLVSTLTISYVLRSDCPSIAGDGMLQGSLQGRAQPLTPELDVLARHPDLVAAAVILPTIDAEFVPLHAPRPFFLLSHRKYFECA